MSGPITIQQPRNDPGRWFSWAELTHSDLAAKRGWDNAPGIPEQAALVALVREVLDPLRELLGVPLRVTSGYRSPAVNLAAGSLPTSQHLLGEAVDVKAGGGMSSEEVVRRLAASALPADQGIFYHPSRGGHVHVSHTTTRANRRMFLCAHDGGGYVPWSST